MHKEDFALQWLTHLGVKVFVDGRQVLTYNGDPDYEIKPLETKVSVSAELGKENDENVYTEMTFDEFTSKGLLILADRNTLHHWDRNQRVCYRIIPKRKTSIGLTYDAFHKARERGGLKIEHDTKHKRIRLLGHHVFPVDKQKPNSGVGEWLDYSRHSYNEPQEQTKVPPMSREQLKAMMKAKRAGVEIDDAEYYYIEDIPLIITDEGYIICMEQSATCPRVICTGKSGMGKSTFINAVSGRMFYKWEYRIGWLIDPQGQFTDISRPQEYNEFIHTISLLGEEPRPLPAIQYYLACKDNAKIVNPNISFKLTVDFFEFLNKFSFYAHGAKLWQLQGAERYLSSVIPHIKDVVDVEELEEELYEAIPNARDKKSNMGSMIFKWKNTFNSIFREQFTSNLYRDDPLAVHEMEIVLPPDERCPQERRLKGHPFIMAMEAGIVPVINTSLVPEKPWVRNVLADIMQKIIEYQKRNEYTGLRNKIMLTVDEMQTIWEAKSGKQMDNASMKFESIFRQGRFNDIGYLGNTQSLEKLNMEMAKNATHICCVQTQSKKERTMIKETFELEKDVVDMLGNLKVQEIMIFTNEPFILYDQFGVRKKITDRKWFKGRIIPPFNFHKCPTIKTQKNEEVEE